MPEGHSVHRIARQFQVNFVGERPSVSSPQGRFAEGAAMIDGREMTDARAVGKQMFLEFDRRDWLRVHLGIYGAWDFAGDVRVDPSIQIHGYTPGHSKLGRILGVVATPGYRSVRKDELSEALGWGFPVQRFAWPTVQSLRDELEVFWPEHRQISALREILPEESVGVLVRAALPR